MRASHTQSPKFSTLFWLGDQLVTFDEYDGLHSTVNGHLSAGLSGMSMMHSDIGGYTMVNEFGLNYTRTKELLLRWAELSAVTDVVFRTHPGNLPDQSAQIYSDDSTLRCFDRMIKIHQASNERGHLVGCTVSPLTSRTPGRLISTRARTSLHPLRALHADTYALF